jgi:PKD repeat protein
MKKWVCFRTTWIIFLPIFLILSGLFTNSGIGDFIFEDDVKPTGDPHWTHLSVGGGGIDLWHPTTLDYATPPRSWWCGRESTGSYEDADSDSIIDENPDDWLNDALLSPILDLSTFETVDLEFMENYSTEPGVDQCWVELSSDSGTTWPTILLDGSTRTGSLGAWQKTVVSVPSPYTSEMQVRFRFDTLNGQNNAYSGWFIDDIRINGTHQLLYPDQEKMGVPGIAISYNLTVNNTQPTPDSFDLEYTSPKGWIYSFFEGDGATPLIDTNSDPLSLPDTDIIPGNTSTGIVVKVMIPDTTILPEADFGIVTATAFTNSSFSDNAKITSRFDFHWYDSFENLTRTDSKNNVIYSNGSASLIGFSLQDGTAWTKKGMVMDVGSPGQNDDKIVHKGTVLKDDGIYKLWYSGHRNNTVYRRILYAESLDGITWNKMGVVVNVGPVGSPDERRTCSPAVIKDYEAPPSQRYKMWYSGLQPGVGFKTLYATSPDGIVWTKWGVVMDRGPGSYDLNQVRPSTVIKAEDGTYRMWYYGWGVNRWSVCYATSSDGINWNKYAGNPVLNLGPAGDLDDFMVLRPWVLIDGKGIYHMWYQGNNQRTNRIFYATSNDGLNWVKQGLAIDLGPLGSLDDNHTAGPMVINDDDGLVKMWYCGYDHFFFRLFYATLPLINETKGDITSETISVPFNKAWSILYVNKTESANTYINVTIINATSGQPIPGFIDLNSDSIDLTVLDWKIYPQIRLVANFTGYGAQTPSLHYWGINWETLPQPKADAGFIGYVNEDSLFTFNGSDSFADAGIVEYAWDIDRSDGVDWIFPDYSGSNLWDPTHTYNVPGIYIVTLNITDASGNHDEDATVVVVFDTTKPVVDVGSNKIIDEDLPLNFNASASYDPEGGSIVWYNWSLGDGNYNNGSDPEPIHIYNDPGIYNVILNISDLAGNWNITTIEVVVNDTTAPDADAGGDVTTYEFVPFELNASLTTDNNGTAGLNYSWDVDGDLIPDYYGKIAQHTYIPIGTYFVTLNVTDSTGNWNVTTIQVDVLVLGFPLANAGPDDVANEDTIYMFDGSGSINSTGAWYNWSFDDGSFNNGTNMFPSHIYDTPGIYIVALNVTNATGWDTDFCKITVIDTTIPNVDVGSDTTIDEDTPYIFDATGSSDNVGIVWYKWSFGDGFFDFGGNETPSHAYLLPGTYTVSLNISDAQGNSNETSIIIQVRDITYPVAVAGFDETIDEDTLFIFNGSGSYDPEGGNIIWYNWSFGDSSYKNGSDPSPNHTYTIPGIYTVILNVTDERGGNSNEATIFITVNDTTNPIADAGPDDQVAEDSQYDFDSSGSTDGEGLGLIQFLWDIDDSDGINWLTPASTLANPQYIYTLPGIYNATLRVIDATGNWDEDTVKITVLDITSPYVDAGFDDSGPEDSQFILNASGSYDPENGTVSSYSWDIDESDGLNWISPDLSGVSPSHIFTVPGIYTVTLNVTDSNGNWALDTVIITVIDITPPIADAGENDSAILNQPYTFDASGSNDPEGGLIITYKWDLNASDGLDWSSPDYEGTSFDHIFFDLGTNVLTLRVEDAQGNFDYDTIEITVIPADIQLPDAPRNVRVETDPKGRALDIVWDENMEPDLDHYMIYFSFDNENFTELTKVPAGTNIFSHTNLTNGVTYYYYILAFDATNNPSNSSDIVEKIPNVDTDLDGVPNVMDPDDDNDGLTDEEEALLGTNPMDKDTDSDGRNDDEDAHPLDPKRWKEEEGEILSWLWILIAIIVIVALVLFLMLARRKKEVMEMPPLEEPPKELPPPPPWMDDKETSATGDEPPPPDDRESTIEDEDPPLLDDEKSTVEDEEPPPLDEEEPIIEDEEPPPPDDEEPIIKEEKPQPPGDEEPTIEDEEPPPPDDEEPPPPDD